MLLSLWRRRVLILFLVCLGALGLTSTTIANQTPSDCVISEATDLFQLYQLSINGSFTYHGRYLYSNCLLVVTYLNPKMISGVPSSNPGGYYDAFALVIGGKYRIHTSANVYQLVRYQTFTDCPAAVATAREFLRQMHQQGLFTMQLEYLREDKIC